MHCHRNSTEPQSAKTSGYSSENLLTSATGGVTLGYDPALRLYQVVGAATTRLAYDGVNAIAEYNGSNALQRRYVFGPGIDQPLVQYEGTGTTDRRFMSADERGSIISLTDSSGALLNIDRYDEYGKPQSTNAGRFQYTGQMWIGEIGAYYYKARVYLPHLGIFAQTDPIGSGGSPNLYAYVLNDPLNFSDPMGLEEEIVVTGHRTPVEVNVEASALVPTLHFGDMTSLGLPGMSTEVEVGLGEDIIITASRSPSRSGHPFTEQSPKQQQQNCYTNLDIRRARRDPKVQQAMDEAIAKSNAEGGGLSQVEYGFWSSNASSRSGVVVWRVGTSHLSHTIFPNDVKPWPWLPWFYGANKPNTFWHSHIPDDALSEEDVENRDPGTSVVAFTNEGNMYCYPG